MPTYNYRCGHCMIEFSAFQSINDDKYTDCKKCDKSNVLERIISGGTGMIFKGGGFYITDYTDYGKKNNKEVKQKNIDKKKLKKKKGDLK